MGRTKAEVNEVTRWLTGYPDLEELDGKTYGEFIAGAPLWNPRSEYSTGKICGVEVETIEYPAMKKSGSSTRTSWSMSWQRGE